MKIYRFLLLFVFVAGTFFSCSKKDDEFTPASELENVEFRTSEEIKEIEIPESLSSSNDPYAQQAAGYIQTVNAFKGQFSQFDAPDNATKSYDPISTAATNGRTFGVQANEVVVYEWNDGYYFIAYQISQTSTHYVHEIFLKTSEEGNYFKYVHAEENKNRIQGFMEVYLDYYFDEEVDELELSVRYDWEQENDGTFRLTSNSFGIKLDIVVYPTGAGEVTYAFEDEIWYRFTWDAQGNGTWAFYDEGEVYQSGSWTVA